MYSHIFSSKLRILTITSHITHRIVLMALNASTLIPEVSDGDLGSDRELITNFSQLYPERKSSIFIKGSPLLKDQRAL